MSMFSFLNRYPKTQASVAISQSDFDSMRLKFMRCPEICMRTLFASFAGSVGGLALSMLGLHGVQLIAGVTAFGAISFMAFLRNRMHINGIGITRHTPVVVAAGAGQPVPQHPHLHTEHAHSENYIPTES